MQNKKYLSLLGLSRRAGRLSMGHDTVLEAIKKRKAKLILFSSDISPRLISEIERASERYLKDVPAFKLEDTIEELYIALGYKAGVLAVTDENFANGIIQEVNKYGD
ncbi:MAG: ribosomal L7Ae/L30e/S12e/Gadd45 family protein [Eubacterium sp.]|nr:ribosomal L7Ae/L30e/S12e/Gadd45 family protein [Eubacterium sp.]